MNTMKLPVGEDVTAFIAQVRAELADLPPDDLDDLTGGLEGDLTELVAESPEGLSGLGTPQAYAAELRSAAGFPPAAPLVAPSWWHTQRDLALANWAALQVDHPVLRHTRDLLVELRPAWWVARGVMAAWAVAGVFGLGGLAWLLALPFIGLSVLLGRRRDRLGDWGKLAVLIGNVVAALVALLAVGALAASGPSGRAIGEHDDPTYGDGVLVNNTPVDNLFVYGPDGRPLQGVRIFTDAGVPLDLAGSRGDANGESLHGPLDIYGKPWDNAFPLPVRPGDGSSSWTPPAALPPLTDGQAGTPTGSPTDSPTGSPTGLPTGVPTGSPTTPSGAATTQPPSPVPTASATRPAVTTTTR